MVTVFEAGETPWAPVEVDVSVPGQRTFTDLATGEVTTVKGPGVNLPEGVIQAAGVGVGAGAGIVGAQPQIEEAGLGPLAALLPGLLGQLGLGGTVGTVAAAGAGIYGLLQALGLGEGEGLFGINLLGGPGGTIPGTDIQLGGPGLPEPGPGTGWTVLKEWHVNYSWGTLQYYLIQKAGQVGKRGRWIALYNTRTKQWKAWRWRAPSLAVIGKNMPRHQMMVRLRKNLFRHTADARQLLKITSPKSLRAPSHRRYRRK